AIPPFVRLPELGSHFIRRAQRFQILAAGHELKPYLLFLANICAIQHGIQGRLPAVELPPSEDLARAREYGMPPLDRNPFAPNPVIDATLSHVLASATFDMPEAAKTALLNVTNASAATRVEIVRSVLQDSIPVEAIAEHLFVAVALQVHFARLAAQL